MIGELADLNARSRVRTANIDFSSTERRTKQLLDLDDVAYADLFDDPLRRNARDRRAPPPGDNSRARPVSIVRARSTNKPRAR
jgi:hypothetical protein